jgi:hypothetical protein
VKRKNATQAKVVIALPFRATGPKGTEKDTVRVKTLGSYRE